MYRDLNSIQEYPYTGEFYVNEETISEDGDLLSEETTTTERVILSTECDIQEASKVYTQGTLTADYNVFFPLDANGTTAVRKGMLFRGEMQGINVNGTVLGIFPSSLGVKVTIKEVDNE
jgi:predicted amino acid-binding ACT domain protein